MTVTVTNTDDGPIVRAAADTLNNAFTLALRKIWANYGTAVKLHTLETHELIDQPSYVRIRVEFPAGAFHAAGGEDASP